MDHVDRMVETEDLLLQSSIDRALAGVPPCPVPDRRDCADCGDPIPRRRLAALPSAERCLGCQSELEVRR